MWIGKSLDKLHVLTPGLVEAGALAQCLELDRRGSGEAVLLLKVADSHSLHGLISLHEKLPDLLQNCGLDVE